MPPQRDIQKAVKNVKGFDEVLVLNRQLPSYVLDDDYVPDVEDAELNSDR